MGERDRKSPDRNDTNEDHAGGAAVPEGRLQFLVDRLGPVGAQRYLQRKIAQRRAARLEQAPAEQMQAAAEKGISGASGPLPHLDAIQRSFGKHDVSQVKAHVDGAAAEGAAAMGAEAFATGDQVAFAGTPNLHTAAHEAAHAVQQRGGVHLKGGVGQEGDEHERHADAVADRVVKGASAEDLLDRYGGGGRSSGAAVQRTIVKSDKTPYVDFPAVMRQIKAKYKHLTWSDAEVAALEKIYKDNSGPPLTLGQAVHKVLGGAARLDALEVEGDGVSSSNPSSSSSSSSSSSVSLVPHVPSNNLSSSSSADDRMVTETPSSSSSSSSSNSASPLVPDLQLATVTAARNAIAVGNHQAAINAIVADPAVQGVIRALGSAPTVKYEAAGTVYGECFYDPPKPTLVAIYPLVFTARDPIPILYSTIRHELIHALQYEINAGSPWGSTSSSSSSSSSAGAGGTGANFAYALEAAQSKDGRSNTAYAVAVEGSEVETHAWEIILSEKNSGVPLDYLYSRAVALQNHWRKFDKQKSAKTERERKIYKASQPRLKELYDEAKRVFLAKFKDPKAWPDHRAPKDFEAYQASRQGPKTQTG